MKKAAVLAVLVAAVVTATASGGNPDPRKCSTNTGTDQSKHAYYCARNAAIAATRARMARSEKVPRWYPGVYCSQNISLLRWTCQTFLGGDHWNVNVVWRATATGWRQTVTVTKTL